MKLLAKLGKGYYSSELIIRFTKKQHCTSVTRSKRNKLAPGE